MRLLIDECVDERPRHEFLNHDCQTARFAGFAGFTNGNLLLAAEAAGFDAIITVDQNIPHQQNLQNRRIAIVILRASTNRLEDLKQTIPAVLTTLAAIRAGEVVIVSGNA